MKIFNVFIIFIVILLIVAGLAFWYFTRMLAAPDKPDSAREVSFEIVSGQSVKQIGQSLESSGVIRSAWAFEWYVWLEGVTDKIQAGEYILNTGQKLDTTVNVITAGEVVSNEVKFQVLEGWTAAQVANYYTEIFAENLNQDAETLKESFLDAVSEDDSRNIIPGATYGFLIDKPETAGLEGYLFPDTYRVYNDATPAQIIQKMLDNFDAKLDDELRVKISQSRLSIYETVTLASIIEKEVRTDQDRKMAADLFLRRLESDMPLQSDATVNYATGKSELQPTIDDTKIDSLYNTYLHKGLPPGPICNPSLASIKAVVEPEPNEYWYYLNAPSGQTIFSKTFEEHVRNKNKYLD